MKRALASLLLVGLCVAVPLPKGTLWHDPGNVAALDFGGSAGAPVGQPRPPFTFLHEDLSGTQLKLFVRDAAGTTWNVKFGYEVRPESFAWRIVRACGYFAEANFYVASGKIDKLRPTQRTDPTLHRDGTFTDARFQYRDPDLKFLDHKNWRWDSVPFGGTKELSGLKILIMLLSNWDNKDSRVGDQGGPNTAIFSLTKPSGTRYIYAFTDWGAGLGSIVPPDARTNWQCSAFTSQSASFVEGVKNHHVVFGYRGNVDGGFDDDIPPAHIAWLMKYLGLITDAQLRAGLKASGANDADAECFTRALRGRIEQLRAVAKAQ